MINKTIGVAPLLLNIIDTKLIYNNELKAIMVYMKNCRIRKDIDVEKCTATVISKLVVVWPAIVGVKIYQWTKVINELSSDGW